MDQPPSALVSRDFWPVSRCYGVPRSLWGLRTLEERTSHIQYTVAYSLRVTLDHVRRRKCLGPCIRFVGLYSYGLFHGPFGRELLCRFVHASSTPPDDLLAFSWYGRLGDRVSTLSRLSSAINQHQPSSIFDNIARSTAMMRSSRRVDQRCWLRSYHHVRL
ncbi:hypothetical protein FKP32DRAFT_100921 [Trametes sanguinea]|nr:hypothetical protein FKP32DRAFT_100921 [Trametes sanguinea]